MTKGVGLGVTLPSIYHDALIWVLKEIIPQRYNMKPTIPLHGALMWRSMEPGRQHCPESNSLFSSPDESHTVIDNEFNALCTAQRCARRCKKLSSEKALPDLTQHISSVEREQSLK